MSHKVSNMLLSNFNSATYLGTGYLCVGTTDPVVQNGPESRIITLTVKKTRWEIEKPLWIWRIGLSMSLDHAH